jgi:hypothetical protein
MLFSGSSHAHFYTMLHGILKPDEDLVAHVMTNLSKSSLFGALINRSLEKWPDSHTNFPNFPMCVCFDQTYKSEKEEKEIPNFYFL